MSTWHRTAKLSSLEQASTLALLQRTALESGRESLDEGRQRVVLHGLPAEHWLLVDIFGNLLAYAQAELKSNTTVELCGGGFDQDLCDSLLETHESILWWLRDSPLHDERTVRTLLLMTADVSLEQYPAIPSGAVVRQFDPTSDSVTWLAHNNAAFADHPEQGAWKLSDLDERCREPWFDPSGFVLLEMDGQIAASCWTKVHELQRNRVGEIYVLSVSPNYQGRGLGHSMLAIGRETLRRRGVHTTMLFVDETNDRAVALYAANGFVASRVDRVLRIAR